MKILLDSNIALDYMLKRVPFYEKAEMIVDMASESLEVFLSASSVTDVYYIARKLLRSKAAAMRALKGLLETVKVTATDDRDIKRAIALDWRDFEDAVQFATGESAFVSFIVTRDKNNFESGDIPVVSPDELLTFLQT